MESKKTRRTVLSAVVHASTAAGRGAILAFAGLALMAAPLSAYPSSFVKSVMSDFLGNMTNATSPSAFESAGRNVFSGGSIYSHGRIFNRSLMTFTPPSFSAGCGGIDMYFGSFSFINTQQLVQLYRTIAQNAVGFLFKIALSVIAPQIDRILSYFQNMIQQLNSLLSNSCDLAQGLATDRLGTAKSLWDGARNAVVNNAKGMWDAIKNPTYGSPQADAVKREENAGTHEAEDKDIYGNIVWKALTREGKQTSSSKLLVGGTSTFDRTMKEELMSMTGGVIIAKPESSSSSQSASSSGSNSTDAVQAVHGFRAVLDLNTFIEGAAYSDTGSKARVYKCDTEDQCLKPVAQDTLGSGGSVSIGGSSDSGALKEGGYRMYMWRMFCGDDVLACNGGIIKKWANESMNEEFTQTEKAFVENLPNDIRTYFANMIKNGAHASGTNGGARDFARRASAVLAVDLAHSTIMQSIGNVEAALASVNNSATGWQEANRYIREAKSDIDKQYEKLANKYGTMTDLNTIAEFWLKNGNIEPYFPGAKAR